MNHSSDPRPLDASLIDPRHIDDIIESRRRMLTVFNDIKHLYKSNQSDFAVNDDSGLAMTNDEQLVLASFMYAVDFLIKSFERPVSRS